MRQYLEFVESFIVIALILSGIAGVSYHLFRDDGWLEMLVGNVFELHVQYPLIAIPLTVGAFVLGFMWRDNRIAKGQRSRLPSFTIYLLMALGAFFIGRYALYGTF